jgi:exonuclease SbcD
MRIKFLQCGDIHLDAPFTSLSDIDGKPDQRRMDLKNILSRIVELAYGERVDLLLVCGDLYEHGYTAKSTIRYTCEQFGRIPDIPVLIIPGNHDPLVPGSYYRDFNWPSNVHILNANSHYEHPSTGARVYGGLTPDFSADRSVINILMHHGTLDMPFSAAAFGPVSGEVLDASGFDYCALGHFHTKIYGAGRNKNIFNAGSPEPLGFDEEGEHGVFISTVEKTPGRDAIINAEFIKMNLRSFINLEVQVGGCCYNEQAAMLIESEMKKRGSSEDLFRITLLGYVSHDFKIDTGSIMEYLEPKAFYIRIINNAVPDYDFEKIAREPGLRGLFTKKMLDRAERAASPEEKQIVMQALYYGLEALDEGRVSV